MLGPFITKNRDTDRKTSTRNVGEDASCEDRLRGHQPRRLLHHEVSPSTSLLRSEPFPRWRKNHHVAAFNAGAQPNGFSSSLSLLLQPFLRLPQDQQPPPQPQAPVEQGHRRHRRRGSSPKRRSPPRALSPVLFPRLRSRLLPPLLPLLSHPLGRQQTHEAQCPHQGSLPSQFLIFFPPLKWVFVSSRFHLLGRRFAEHQIRPSQSSSGFRFHRRRHRHDHHEFHREIHLPQHRNILRGPCDIHSSGSVLFRNCNCHRKRKTHMNESTL